MAQTVRSFCYVLSGFVFALIVTSVTATSTSTVSAQESPPQVATRHMLDTSVMAQAKKGALSIGSDQLPTPGSTLDVHGITATEGLLVRGSLLLADGSQKAGRVLVSDNEGLAQWQDLPQAKAVENFEIDEGISNLVIESYTFYDGHWPMNLQGADRPKSDPVTQKRICREGGFTAVTAVDSDSFDEPEFYQILEWNVKSSSWKMMGASAFNNGIQSLTCARIVIDGKAPAPFIWSSTSGPNPYLLNMKAPVTRTGS